MVFSEKYREGAHFSLSRRITMKKTRTGRSPPVESSF
jgi:hypothetical protein